MRHCCTRRQVYDAADFFSVLENFTDHWSELSCCQTVHLYDAVDGFCRDIAMFPDVVASSHVAQYGKTKKKRAKTQKNFFLGFWGQNLQNVKWRFLVFLTWKTQANFFLSFCPLFFVFSILCHGHAKSCVPEGDLADGFHKYAFEWTEKGFKSWVDNIVIMDEVADGWCESTFGCGDWNNPCTVV